MENIDKFGVSPAMIQEVAAKLENLVFEKNSYTLLGALGQDEGGGDSAPAHGPERIAEAPTTGGTHPSTNRMGVMYKTGGNFLYIGVLRDGDHNFYCGLDGQSSILVYGSAVEAGFYSALDLALSVSRERGTPAALKYKGAFFSVAPPHGGQKIGFSYRLIFPGLEVLIHRSPSEKIPLAKVVFGWQACDKGNLLSITSEVLGWLGDCGSDVLGYHISRLDLQCTGDFDIQPLIKAAEDDRFVSMQRKKTTVSEGLAVQTLTIGGYSSPVMLRIYDKLQEMADSGDATKETQILGRFRRAWKEGGWDWSTGNIPPLNRVEFSCKREFLKVWGINTFDDLREKITSLCYFLTHQWLRFTEPTEDTNTRRAPVLQEWQRLGVMFCRYFWGGCEEMQRIPEKECSAFLSDEQRRRARASATTFLAKLIADEALRGGLAAKMAGFAVINDVRGDAILEATTIIKGVLAEHGDIYKALSCD